MAGEEEEFRRELAEEPAARSVVDVLWPVMAPEAYVALTRTTRRLGLVVSGFAGWRV